MRLAILLASLVAFMAHASVEDNNDVAFETDPGAYRLGDTIVRDFVIIGGGSSGTYTAIRLRDHGKSVVVVEKKDTLGGHAETYTNPFTGYTVDMGVVVFARLKAVTDYFARFEVPLVEVSSTITDVEYVDFASGESVEFQPPSEDAFMAALDSYATQLAKYPELERGFNISSPVPSDLLLPFCEFVAKYQLQDLVPRVFTTNQGFVPLLDISTLYVLKYLNAAEVRSLREGFLTTAHHNVQELYGKATGFLESDVLLGTTILAIDRSCSPVRVLVKTPAGPKLILAKKLVTTVPPMPENLGGYDLSDDEQVLFEKFYANGYYTAVLNNTGINEALIATGPGQPYNVPTLPGPYSITITPEGLTQVYYGSSSVMSDEEVQADILSNIQRFQSAQGVPQDTEPEWLAFASHSPFNLMVSNEAIANGFYRDLYGLQGQRNTFYNGAAWQTQDSSVLWEFTDDYIIPMCLASL